MRYWAAAILLSVTLSTQVRAEQTVIDQYAWLNYAIVVTAQEKTTDVSLQQRGTINGISSAQFAGNEDAYLQAFQKGNRNTTVAYQAGWNASSRVAQSGPEGFSGYTNLPTTFSSREVDEGYLSYFMTGGFSLVVLTDANHTWLSRFGRAR